MSGNTNDLSNAPPKYTHYKPTNQLIFLVPCRIPRAGDCTTEVVFHKILNRWLMSIPKIFGQCSSFAATVIHSLSMMVSYDKCPSLNALFHNLKNYTQMFQSYDVVVFIDCVAFHEGFSRFGDILDSIDFDVSMKHHKSSSPDEQWSPSLFALNIQDPLLELRCPIGNIFAWSN